MANMAGGLTLIAAAGAGGGHRLPLLHHLAAPAWATPGRWCCMPLMAFILLSWGVEDYFGVWVSALLATLGIGTADLP